jgi:peptide/nickel transport system ATP-binding protein/oligopeptide transport system ATP-binding protein
MSQPPAPLVEVEGLSIAFGARQVVRDVGFRLSAGGTLALVGESGSGKSLTALSLLGLLPPGAVASGRVRLAGQEVIGAPQHALRRLRGGVAGMVFQEPMNSLNPLARIGRQVTEAIQLHRPMPAAAARTRAVELLAEVGFPDGEQRLDAFPHQLSGGQRQRVMIAMALANDPALLIADEPTTALDVTIQAQILDLLGDLQARLGMAILIITHDLGVIAEIADDVIVMYAGKIVESAPVKQLFADPQHPYTIGLLGSIPRLGEYRERLATIEGTVPSPANQPKGCRFSPRCPFSDARCRDEPPPLRDVGAPGHAVACWKAPVEQFAEVAA